MRILIALTYYHPHKSGLTLYAVKQARALADRGHEVTILTSQFDRKLPEEEWDSGVRVVRLPVAFRLSKGVVMPKMLFKAWALIGQADIVNLHVPQFDASLLALLAKMRLKPVVLTYHCDLRMPNGLINKIAGWGAYVTNFISAILADVIVHNTRDFAIHSTFLRQFLNKLVVIQPPILVEKVSQDDVSAFRKKYHTNPDHPVIGMLSRLAAEKGVEYLVKAMPEIIRNIPNARVIFVGDYEHVIGEKDYKTRVLPLIEALGQHWNFLGVVSELDKAVFLQECDVLVLPSINSTESFGMVQVEAMISGTPVVATDLPGVRQPVLTTGMGKIVPARNSDDLCEAIVDILNSLSRYYAPETVGEEYERLFLRLLECDE
jgi:glycosyltransferase involved in cell wall biosynthesis